MRFKLSVIITIFCFFLVGCSLMPNELKLAERVIETQPDSALHILKRMKYGSSMSDGDRALYGVLYFQALDKNRMPLKPDSLIDFSLKYYSKQNDNVLLANCYFYKAKSLKSSQRYDDATVLYLRALSVLPNSKDYILLAKVYGDMGDICSMQMDYVEALKKYQQSINFFYQAGDTVEACYRIIYIGRVYRFLKDYKKAQVYYHRAISQTTDSLLQGSGLQEIGINYYKAQKLDSAQYYLHKSLDYPYRGMNYSIRLYSLAELYFDMQEYDSAFTCAATALKYPSTFYTQRDCYRILANTEYQRKDFKQLAAFISKYQDCTDSVRKIETQTKTSVLENLYQTNDKVSKTKYYLQLLGFVIAIVLIISFLIVFRLRNRNKGKEKELEVVEEKLNEKQLLLKDSLLQKIEEVRSQKMREYKKASLKERELMDKDLYISCLHINDWNVFRSIMNKTFNNLIFILETKYEDISQKEMIWCCLFLLDIPTPDIALVLETQSGSLYKLKQRLAQKMKLNSTIEFNQLLKDLSVGK